MKVSNKGLDLIMKYEGFRSKAYLCPAKVWTIGYGTTKYANGTKVKAGDVISKETAKQLLFKQVEQHASTIPTYVKVELNQNQFDALASFQYNLGKHILKGSKLLKLINDKKWTEAAEIMKLYNKAGGKVLMGLVKRRNDEASLFLSKSKLVEDGIMGVNTIKALQESLGVTVDGKFGKKSTIALQQKVGAVVDGIIGPKTVGALAKKLGVVNKTNFIEDKAIVLALQKAINQGTF